MGETSPKSPSVIGAEAPLLSNISRNSQYVRPQAPGPKTIVSRPERDCISSRISVLRRATTDVDGDQATGSAPTSPSPKVFGCEGGRQERHRCLPRCEPCHQRSPCPRRVGRKSTRQACATQIACSVNRLKPPCKTGTSTDQTASRSHSQSRLRAGPWLSAGPTANRSVSVSPGARLAERDRVVDMGRLSETSGRRPPKGGLPLAAVPHPTWQRTRQFAKSCRMRLRIVHMHRVARPLPCCVAIVAGPCLSLYVCIYGFMAPLLSGRAVSETVKRACV